MTNNPTPAADAAGRAMAAGMIAQMRHAVLGVLDPATGVPHLARIACQPDRDGVPLALLSGIAAHSRALIADPRAGLLIAAPGPAKGDPMTRPRLSLQVRASLAPPDPDRRAAWLSRNPKAAVFIDLPDFRFWRLVVVSGFLNAGFGRATALQPQDLQTPETPA